MNRRQCVAQVLVLGVAGAVLLASPALAQDCPELAGQWPYGPAHAVAVSGNYAYFGSGAALLVADVSIPAALHVVGDVTLPGVVHGVAVSGSYAYVAGTGLHVVDVSTPSAPVEVGSVDTPGWAEGVAVAGGYAYVADDHAGLRVIDVTTPSAPIEVGFVDTPGSALDVAVAGLYAFVADDYAGLRVIDVSTPSAPVEVGSVDIPNWAVGVAVSGGYAYVAGSYAVRVIDVSTPSAPVEVGSVDSPGYALGVAVSGSYVYVAGTGLHVVDVSTPSAPVEVGSVDTPGWAEGVAVSGLYAFVADDYAGLRVIDVSTPSAPIEVGFVDTPGNALDVAVSGSYAYVAGTGLHVVDVSTPSAPIEVGSIETPGVALGVAVAGGYAYVVDYHSLRVIDVSTPSEPVEVGSADAPEDALDVAVAGGHAYVADGYGLRVIDVSTPSAPVEVGFADIPGAYSVAVAGLYAYVGDGGGLRVIDVSTPSAPIEVGFVDTPGYAYGVAVSGGYAYVADYYSLRVIDVSPPSAPVEVGSVDTPDDAVGVAVAGGYAYVAAGSGGLRVIDVSTPSAPVEVGSANTPDDALGVAVSSGYVFVADFEAGLSVFRDCAPGPTPDPRECIIPAAAVAAGAQGAFFSTDLEINNTGTDEAQIYLEWLPRGEDNSEPIESEPITLASGQSLRYENVLTELFNLGPDSLGALKLVASTGSVIGMSRTYNSPEGEIAGTFGQGLPAIRATDMIQGTEPQRIIFLSENDDSRANVGCVNGTDQPLRINIGIFDAEGSLLETRTMDLGPYSNNQINRVFRDYQPVNGYVDVWADSIDALYYCYGSMLDNLTSDPTTILPQVPSADTSFIPAAALAAGLEGSFFTTDVDLNNAGSTDLTYRLVWLPRGADNTGAVHSDLFALAAGAGVRYANVLDEVFGLEPDQVGALAVEAGGIDLLAMSRTYNLPSAKVAGTFGQELPGIPADRMIPTGVKKRIIFMSENDDVRANVGCINGAGIEVVVQIELYDSDGVKIETKYMMLPPYSNRQINGIFRYHAPVNGYVDVRTSTPGASIYCYGSVLDNLTSDPTTVLPQ
ncbi:MAG TPA: hypothetical protein PLM61_05400 [Thermoanaerobaculales bacterium]|nr:hypothetical protein [Thermoanaerobaculales bacterium]